MGMIAAVDKAGLALVQRAKLLLGMEKPDPALVRQIHDIQPLPLLKGEVFLEEWASQLPEMFGFGRTSHGKIPTRLSSQTH
jgi:hypothetical protein